MRALVLREPGGISSALVCEIIADPIPGPHDRRSVLVQRTVAGNGFMRDLKTILANADKEVGKMPSRGRRIGETV